MVATQFKEWCETSGVLRNTSETTEEKLIPAIGIFPPLLSVGLSHWSVVGSAWMGLIWHRDEAPNNAVCNPDMRTHSQLTVTFESFH